MNLLGRRIDYTQSAFEPRKVGQAVGGHNTWVLGFVDMSDSSAEALVRMLPSSKFWEQAQPWQFAGRQYQVRGVNMYHGQIALAMVMYTRDETPAR